MPQNKHEETKKPSLFARIKQALLGSPKEIPEPVKIQAQKAVPQKRDNARSQNTEYGSVPELENKKPGDGYSSVTPKGQSAEYFNANDASKALPGKTKVTEYGALQNPTQYSGMPNSLTDDGDVPRTASKVAAAPPSSADYGGISDQQTSPHQPIKINEIDAQFLESKTLPQVNYQSNNPSEMIFLNYNAVLGNMEKAIANQDLAQVAQRMGASTPEPSAKLQSIDIHFEDSKDGKTPNGILSVSLRLSHNGKTGKDDVSYISKDFDLSNKDELNAFVQFLNQNAAKPAPKTNNATPAHEGASSAPPSNYAATPNSSTSAPPSNYVATPSSAPSSNYKTTPSSTPASNYSELSSPSQQSALSNAADNYGQVGKTAAKAPEKTNYASMPPSAAATTTNNVKVDKPSGVTASLSASLAKILELKADAKVPKENATPNTPSTRFDDAGALKANTPPPKPSTPPRFLGTAATAPKQAADPSTPPPKPDKPPTFLQSSFARHKNTSTAQASQAETETSTQVATSVPPTRLR